MRPSSHPRARGSRLRGRRKQHRELNRGIWIVAQLPSLQASNVLHSTVVGR